MTNMEINVRKIKKSMNDRKRTRRKILMQRLKSLPKKSKMIRMKKRIKLQIKSKMMAMMAIKNGKKKEPHH